MGSVGALVNVISVPSDTGSEKLGIGVPCCAGAPRMRATGTAPKTRTAVWNWPTPPSLSRAVTLKVHTPLSLGVKLMAGALPLANGVELPFAVTDQANVKPA